MKSAYSTSFIGDQPGRWRVTAIGDSTWGNSKPSAWRKFSFGSKVPLGTPVLVSPSDKTVFSNYPRIITYAWMPVPGATDYNVETSYQNPKTGIWSEPVSSKVTGVTNSAYTTRFIGAQPGRWRVTAVDSTSKFIDSPPSDWRYFIFTI
jgi:hypothetical protein